MWGPAFVSERVKDFRSAVGGGWRMGLLCAPLLSRGPGGQGSAGKGFVMSQACSGWAALLFSLPAHNPFHRISPSVALSSRTLLLKERPVCHVNGSDIPVNSVDPFKTCLCSGRIFLVVVGLHHQFSTSWIYRGCQISHSSCNICKTSTYWMCFAIIIYYYCSI